MIIINSNLNLSEKINLIDTNTVACIGFFDGIHKLHKKIMNKTKTISKKQNIKWVLITFSSKVDQFLKGIDLSVYNSDIKYKLIESLYNPDFLIEVNIDYKTISTSKEDFCKYLKTILNVKYIVVGQDFKFGKNRLGDVKYLIKYFGRKNIISFKRNKKYSTSYIRYLLINGKIKKINKIIGYNFPIIIKYLNNKFIIKSTKLVFKDGFYILKIKNLEYLVNFKNNEIFFKQTDLKSVFFDIILRCFYIVLIYPRIITLYKHYAYRHRGI
ncbi:hypothetical protein [Spiroplasma turonicum]|uniref:FAD synthase n=1 Tax=Spiroplasma turonicum TaxID=216946 RepID=A0A0K1P5Q7_9MOLU|nr:hypothetical protein [Spiroplasma turonicum]AKU79585.1 bifunctional riboflavin kinase/FMN adenylyltransferase [Spiroplasma turonicum]ALX70607.1 bifunctional riboflavin kinase/FMN adenylyltransferase [Spiroplasma turonicum]